MAACYSFTRFRSLPGFFVFLFVVLLKQKPGSENWTGRSPNLFAKGELSKIYYRERSD